MTVRNQIDITAYHEAGHAVMTLACGFIVNELSIEGTEEGKGHVSWGVPDPDSEISRKKSVLVFAAGIAADYLHWQMVGGAQDDVSEGHFSDQRQARAILELLGQEPEAFDRYLAATIKFLKDPEVWEWVVGFAELMLAGAKTINGTAMLNRAAQNCPKISEDELAALDRAIAAG